MSNPVLSLLWRLQNYFVNRGWAPAGESTVSFAAHVLVDGESNLVLDAGDIKRKGGLAAAVYQGLSRQTANFTAAVGGTYGMDTTAGSITCTPPPAPNDGDWFRVFDVAKTWVNYQAVIGSGALNFIDKSNRGPTAGPYDLNDVPYVGQGFITFVWYAAVNVWSVN